MTSLEIENLRKLDSKELRSFVTMSAQNERHHMMRVLYGLQEIERKRLHLEWGFSGLHQFCVVALGYSEGSAARRVQASRLLRDVPDVKAKLEEGTLSLSVAAQAQSFFYRESKLARSYTSEGKRELLKKLDHKTSRETEVELLKLSPQALPQERLRQVTPEHQELRVILDAEIIQALEEFKALASHQLPNDSHQEVLRLALTIAAETLRKKKLGADRKTQAATEPPLIHNITPTSVPTHVLDSISEAPRRVESKRRGSRFISVATKRAVWERDGGACAYVDPETHRRCSSKIRLEFDHYPIPFSRGGKSTPQNLRLLCRVHNAYGAEKIFGRYRMPMGNGFSQSIKAKKESKGTRPEQLFPARRNS